MNLRKTTVTCPECKGTGRIFYTAKAGSEREAKLRAKGYEPVYDCLACKGTGRK